MFTHIILFNIYIYIYLTASGLSGSTWNLCQAQTICPGTPALSVVGFSSFRACLNCSAACGVYSSPTGIELMSPELQGEFLTTGPPGKFPPSHLIFSKLHFADEKADSGCETGGLLDQGGGKLSLNWDLSVFLWSMGVSRLPSWLPTLKHLPAG